MQGPYLLHKAVRGTAADIKRLHAVRHCFYNFDLGAPESLQTSRSIQRLAASPVVLKSAEGRRLVAFMFDHCPELTHDLVATIRNQIAGGQAYVLDAYGTPRLHDHTRTALALCTVACAVCAPFPPRPHTRHWTCPQSNCTAECQCV